MPLLHLVYTIVTPCYMAYLIINRLQWIQNSTARIMTNTRKYDHITPILQKLHWLPVRHRIHFKNLLITYKSINIMASDYLCELLTIRKSSRKLRSSSQILLQVPMSRLKTYGDCVFSVAATHVCEIGCRQILELRRLLKCFNLF